MARLAGKTALITGGSSGIGLSTAKAFVAEGARVAITGRDEGALQRAADEIGGDVVAVRCDVARLDQIDALGARIAKEFAGLDILFANAGLFTNAPIGAISEAEFDDIFDINVKGVFFTVQSLLPVLRRGASIILNASIAWRMGRPGISLYAASKAAVRTFARNFSADLAPRGIRVNVISPGPIDTSIWERGRDAATADRLRRKIEAAVPMGRMGRAEEIASAAVFLASDESAYMMGAELIIDGGSSEVPGALSL
jgi:NAD(P)-dependent dehydrogenase (short-subunit alcohol dehydrogenase family)